MVAAVAYYEVHGPIRGLVYELVCMDEEGNLWPIITNKSASLPLCCKGSIALQMPYTMWVGGILVWRYTFFSPCNGKSLAMLWCPIDGLAWVMPLDVA